VVVSKRLNLTVKTLVTLAMVVVLRRGAHQRLVMPVVEQGKLCGSRDFFRWPHPAVSAVGKGLLLKIPVQSVPVEVGF
jgi:hypothetical protein